MTDRPDRGRPAGKVPLACAVEIAPDAESLAARAADRVTAALSEAIRLRGAGHLMLTGGTTPKRLYELLAVAPRREMVDWSRVWLWMGDERFVPDHDALSNARLATLTLLGPTGVPVPADQVRFIPTGQATREGRSADWCALRYAEEMRRHLPASDDRDPVVDVLLLGVGSDGHVLSVFPGRGWTDADRRSAFAVPAPGHIDPKVGRVTVSPRLIGAARAVLVLVQGETKAEIVAEVLGAPSGANRYPAALARGPNTTWMIDQAAAAKLVMPGSSAPDENREAL